MIDHHYLEKQMLEVCAALTSRNNELKVVGIRAAEAERTYRVALAKKFLEMRNSGLPATLIGDLARGDEAIAALKLERDTAEACLDAVRSKLAGYRVQADILRSLFAWERSDRFEHPMPGQGG